MYTYVPFKLHINVPTQIAILVEILMQVLITKYSKIVITLKATIATMIRVEERTIGSNKKNNITRIIQVVVDKLQVQTLYPIYYNKGYSNSKNSTFSIISAKHTLWLPNFSK